MTNTLRLDRLISPSGPFTQPSHPRRLFAPRPGVPMSALRVGPASRSRGHLDRRRPHRSTFRGAVSQRDRGFSGSVSVSRSPCDRPAGRPGRNGLSRHVFPARPTPQVTTHRVPCERISHPKRLVSVELHVADQSSEGRRDCSKLPAVRSERRTAVSAKRFSDGACVSSRASSEDGRGCRPQTNRRSQAAHNRTQLERNHKLYAWRPDSVGRCRTRSGCRAKPPRLSPVPTASSRRGATLAGVARSNAAPWLILPVVICLSQRLSHACLSTSQIKVKPRKAH